ncbi:hypothetical protein DFJ74DRAFT_357913 [Hyaloraphidium curvatum]|nr:hypothetical protein DFJ74DRAFT_357913 [Hyaloraphidium curvatum]
MRPLNALLALALAALLAVPNVAAQDLGYARSATECSRVLGGTDVTVIFTADPGQSYGGIGEGYYIALALKAPRNVTIAGCYNATVGTIAGQRVAQIVTGEGPSTAQMCIFQVLSCSSVIKEIMFFGTAGFSPRVGGLLNPGNCEPPANPDPATLVRPGDLCVSLHAINWDCQGGPWSQTAAAFPQECSVPGSPNQPFVDAFTDRSSADFRGWDCFVDVIPNAASRRLADELMAGRPALQSVVPPAPVQEYTQWYFGNTTLAMGPTFSPNVSAPPRAFGPSVCAEVDSVFWWTGTPWDAQARGMVGYAVNVSGLASVPSGAFLGGSVVAASAMESIGMLAAQRNARRLTGIDVPYAIVRSASDYNLEPNVRSPANASVWLQGPSVAKPPGLSSDTATATVYAIQTGSQLILGALRQRCLAAGGSAAVCNDQGTPSVGVRGAEMGVAAGGAAAVAGAALNLLL